MKFTYHNQVQFNDKEFETRIKNFKNLVNDPSLGFFHLTDQTHFLSQVKEAHEKIKDKKNFVQVGIGGSALGPEMLVHALAKNDKKFFCLDNTDSDYLKRQLDQIDLNDSVFYVVSKSGGTAETIACYSILRSLGAKNFVFCTDPKNGQLRAHVEENNFLALDIPSNIGGRFSVLSPVGLLPALFMGLDIEALYAGANKIKETLLCDQFEKNDLFKSAAMIFEAYKSGVNQTVLMPYSSLLKSFSAWFVQLWAESLGKISHRGPVGLTPIPAYGATDQHSQVQLFMEGPNDKLLFMISVANRNNDYQLNSELNMDSGKKLAPYSMNQLLEAEFRGSIQALSENKRNVIEINLDRLEESSMGAMILFFESLTAVMGDYFEINAFNQPGVELGKKYAFEFLDSMQK